MSVRVAVVGGGITGLSAAFELLQQGAEVAVIEAEDRVGGRIATSRTPDGLVVEAGPESFLSSKPAATDLCHRLGIASRLIDTRPDDQRTFVWSRARLRALPPGLVLGSPSRAGSLVRSGLLSLPGAARMALDVVVPPQRRDSDESIAAFFTRRLGRQASQRVVEPLLAGIHAGDPEKLSLAATFPRFLDMERTHGSLVRATFAARRNSPLAPPAPAPRTPFVSLHGGMAELIEALESALVTWGAQVRRGIRVAQLDRGPESWGYRLGFDKDGPLDVDAVVVATPAFVAAGLLQRLSPGAARLLRAIPYASTATVSLAYRVAELERTPEGHGFVVPRVEGRRLNAVTWSSNKWAGRAPAGQVLLRGYIGGTGREALLSGGDDDLVAVVRAELAELAGIAAVPVHVEVHRHHNGMPQYTIGHQARVAGIRAELAAWPGLAVTGAAYSGAGIPDCVAGGAAAAAEVLARLQPAA